MNQVTRASLSQELIRRTPVILPPLTEQQEILVYLDTKTQQIDKLMFIAKTSFYIPCKFVLQRNIECSTPRWSGWMLVWSNPMIVDNRTMLVWSGSMLVWNSSMLVWSGSVLVWSSSNLVWMAGNPSRPRLGARGRVLWIYVYVCVRKHMTNAAGFLQS